MGLAKYDTRFFDVQSDDRDIRHFAYFLYVKSLTFCPSSIERDTRYIGQFAISSNQENQA